MQKSLKEILYQKLKGHFHPQVFEIEDQSALHKGHVGVQKGSETHFKIKLNSPLFMGLSRIERHRLVYDVIGESLMSRIHALTLVLHDKL